MKKYGHGGDIYSGKIAYDFSANINPLGMPESVKKALVNAADSCEHYPDSACRELVDAIVRHEAGEFLLCGDDWELQSGNTGCEAGSSSQSGYSSGKRVWLPGSGHIVCGNGAADLIYRMVYVLRPRKALLPAPSFVEYAKALEGVRCEIVYYMMKEEQMFDIREDICEWITNDMDMLFLCNPNNPVGSTIEPSVLEKVIERCDKKQVYVVLDECFMEFVDGAQHKSGRKYVAKYSNVILLKAFTKIYAMAGLRLGYGICRDDGLIERVWDEGQCWSVSVPAQAAGVAALEERDYVKRTRAYVAQEREYLRSHLERLGCLVFHGEANYLFFRVPNGLEQLGERLLEQGIAIRDCSNYVGLNSSYYRIAVRTHVENEILIDAMKCICDGIDGDRFE